ncbi:MAG: phosphoglycerate kinase [Verrucomicrobiota bacterium]
MAKKTIRDLDVAGKRVLVRVDFNVPLDEAGKITDDTRIRAALPTIEFLSEAGAKVVLMSHLGRPKGERKPEFSLKPVAERLGELISAKVSFAEDCVGDVVEAAVAGLGDGDVLLLENVRFYKEETENDPGFAERLAKLGDVYVNDAFGTAHRAHASTAGVAAYLPESAMGFLMEKELKYLQEELEEPARPFVVIMGGAKVSDKIGVMSQLMDKADTILIGGAMANTFRLAQGYEVGKSLAERDKLDVAREILKRADETETRLVLPADTRHTAEFADDAPTECTAPYEDGGAIPEDREGIDIGDVAIEEFRDEIAKAGTIVWNGPVGVFEKRGFDIGTRAVGEAVAASGAKKIVGGGDSVTAVNQFGLADRMDHISTGGGASLELLEGKELPGVAALSDK